ncbi:hypothetical protein MVI01_33110 [Myxococcus virescens]|uniref:Uncharacterized protein n=1 Tax=Myxococcus virescens TaxID=83456 RepID=A0A511HD94_9BACT|nr:hypothetical protein MVI01_33110 [Myxococcus virescens]
MKARLHCNSNAIKRRARQGPSHTRPGRDSRSPVAREIPSSDTSPVRSQRGQKKRGAAVEPDA